MKYIRGYRSVALLSMLVCAGFFFAPGVTVYGTVFDTVNFFGAGVIFFGSLLAYIENTPKRWTLWVLVAAMAGLVGLNTFLFVSMGAFLSTGFPLIAYDALFAVTTLHFLGKGL